MYNYFNITPENEVLVLPQVMNEFKNLIAYSRLSHAIPGMSDTYDTFTYYTTEDDLPLGTISWKIRFAPASVYVSISYLGEEFYDAVFSRKAFTSPMTLSHTIYDTLLELFRKLKTRIHERHYKELHLLTKKQVVKIDEYLLDILQRDYQINSKTNSCYRVEHFMKELGFETLYYTNHPYEGFGNEYLTFGKSFEDYHIVLKLRISYHQYIYVENLYLDSHDNNSPFRYIGFEKGFLTGYLNLKNDVSYFYKMIKSTLWCLYRKVNLLMGKRFPELLEVSSDGEYYNLKDKISPISESLQKWINVSQTVKILISKAEGLMYSCPQQTLGYNKTYNSLASVLSHAFEGFNIMDRNDSLGNSFYTLYKDYPYNYGIVINLEWSLKTIVISFDLRCRLTPKDEYQVKTETFRALFQIPNLYDWFRVVSIIRSLASRVASMVIGYTKFMKLYIPCDGLRELLEKYATRYHVDYEGFDKIETTFLYGETPRLVTKNLKDFLYFE